MQDVPRLPEESAPAPCLPSRCLCTNQLPTKPLAADDNGCQHESDCQLPPLYHSSLKPCQSQVINRDQTPHLSKGLLTPRQERHRLERPRPWQPQPWPGPHGSDPPGSPPGPGSRNATHNNLTATKPEQSCRIQRTSRGAHLNLPCCQPMMLGPSRVGAQCVLLGSSRVGAQ